jgi:hypothetical protein
VKKGAFSPDASRRALAAGPVPRVRGLTLAGALGMARFLPPSGRGRSGSVGLAYGEMLGHLRDRRLVGGFLIGFALGLVSDFVLCA